MLIAYSDMWTPEGEKPQKRYCQYGDISPKGVREGKLWFDRLEYTNC